MSAPHPDVIAADVLAALTAAERLQAYSRTEPHLFAEQKDGLVRRLREIYADLRGVPTSAPTRLPKRDTTFRSGMLARRGRLILVQRRGERQPR